MTSALEIREFSVAYGKVEALHRASLRVAEGATVRFEELFPTGLEATRERIVLAFLSILELAKIQALLIFQNATSDGRPDGPIRVRLAVGSTPDEAEIEAAAAEAEAEFSTRVDLEEIPEAAAADEPDTGEGGDAW